MAGVAGIVGAGASLASAGAGIANAASGGSSAWHPSKQQMNAYGNQYAQDLSTIQPYALNYASQAIPQFQQQTQAAINNPYAPQAQAAANQAASYGANTLVPMEQQGAQTLQGLGNLAASQAPALVQQAFDPQQALYNRTYQQLMDQQNAINAQNGVAGSPYAAGLAGQTASNFNIDWQNQQLQRMLTGVQGLGALGQSAGQGLSGASALGGSAVTGGAAAGALPSNTYLSGINSNLAALGMQNQGVSQAFDPSQVAMGDITSILGLGNQGQSQNFLQNQTLGANLGQSLAGVQNAFSNPNLAQLFNPNSISPVNVTPSIYGGY